MLIWGALLYREIGKSLSQVRVMGMEEDGAHEAVLDEHYPFYPTFAEDSDTFPAYSDQIHGPEGTYKTRRGDVGLGLG